MIGFLRRLWLRYMDRHDPELAKLAQRPIQKFAGYDYAKAKAGYERAKRTSETGRLLPRPKAQKKPVPPLRFKKAGDR